MNCPKCSGVRISTERRPNGNHVCGSCGHVWPNREDNIIPGNQVIENSFMYHTPKEGQSEKYGALRSKAKELAYLIDDVCPNSREKSLAMTQLEQSVMWANAAVARN